MSEVWVRRCAGCASDDPGAAYGRRAIEVDDDWCCRSCGTHDWIPVRYPFPTDTAASCPYQRGEHSQPGPSTIE